MNIMIYNYDDVSSKELNDFSARVKASIFIAITFAEAERLLNSRKMDAAVLKLINASEAESLLKLIGENPQTKFFVSANSETNKFNKYNIKIGSSATPLYQIAKQLNLGTVKE